MDKKVRRFIGVVLLLFFSVNTAVYAIHNVDQLKTLGLVGLQAAPAAAVAVQDRAMIVNIFGEIKSLTVDDPLDMWSAGTAVIDGETVVIPRNLFIDLPANRLTLQQIFAQAPPACQALGESGLASTDLCLAGAPGAPSPSGAWITLTANRMPDPDNRIIAGDILIEKGLGSVMGLVTYIDTTDGYLRVNGDVTDPANTGVMVRLNDPDSRHTIQQGAGCDPALGTNCSADPRFTLDPDNYTIMFTSGYPACIPSSVARAGTVGSSTGSDANGIGDALCPDSNRPPAGQAVPDSTRFAPIQLGDHIAADGNYEEINGVRFLSAHTLVVSQALITRNDPTQPDYMVPDEAFLAGLGFQNERVIALFIGFTTLSPADVEIAAIHYDPVTNAAHEFPLASTWGCELAAGPGTCTTQGIGGGVGPGKPDIFKVRYDVDFLTQPTAAKLSPCAHLRAGGFNVCPNGGTFAEDFAVLAPLSREIIFRTRQKLNRPSLVVMDINGEESPWGEYLFPFGLNLGGIEGPEFGEIDLDMISSPNIFTGLPWTIDRRLSPGGCIDTTGDSIPDCEPELQPLTPYPYSGLDPRTQAFLPISPYFDPAYTSSPLSTARDRVLAYVSGPTGNFDGDNTILPWPPPAAPSPPVAVNDNATTLVDTPTTIDVLANDFDRDGGVITIIGLQTVSNAGGAVVDNLNGTVTYTPTFSFLGTDVFTYTIGDGNNGSNSAMVTVVVHPPNAQPVAADDAVATDEDNAVNVNVLGNDSDPDGDTLTVDSVTAPANGAAVINPDSTVTYTPNPDFSGSDSFDYAINDGKGGAHSAAVNVTVNPVQDAPVAADDAVSAFQNTPVMIPGADLLANDTDADGDALVISAMDLYSAAALNAISEGKNPPQIIDNGDGTYAYEPPDLFIGDDTFSYTVDDGNGNSHTAVVNVTVLPVDTITTRRVDFREARGEWRIIGTAGPEETITVYVGPTVNGGTFLSTTTSDVFGLWRLRVFNSSVFPDPNNPTISVLSSGGGALEGVTVDAR
ncbi:MAG: cadherin-like domain-containing protein [Anaerolineae bacterium]